MVRPVTPTYTIFIGCDENDDIVSINWEELNRMHPDWDRDKIKIRLATLLHMASLKVNT